MERPRCKTCPYWNFDASDSLELFSLKMLEDGGMVGECRRFPASSGFSPADEWYKSDGPPIPKAFAVSHVAQFYLVTDGDWCGEHPDFPAYIASLKPLPTPACNS
jgi:hypothetical protein